MAKITHLTDENTDITYEIADEYARSRLDSIPSGISESASGSAAVFTDSAALPMQSVIAYINATQDLHGYDKPWGAGCGKNLMPNNPTVVTNTGITFTYNSDKSITANGTAEGNVVLSLGSMIMKANTEYILTGCPSGGGARTWRLYPIPANSAWYDEGSGKTLPVVTEDTVKEWRLVIYNGATADNITFYPMIRISSETDATYVPYENYCPIEKIEQVNITRTSKNLLPNTAVSATDHGVQFTVNSDGSITANGTATGGNASCVVAADLSIPTGDGMIITGCPSGGSSTKYDCRVLADNSTYYNDYGSGKAIPSGLIITRSIIVIRQNVTVNDLTFYPMLRSASFSDASYESYVSDTYTVAVEADNNAYKGVLNVTIGKLTLTHKLLEFDGTTVGKRMSAMGSYSEGQVFTNAYINVSDGNAYGRSSSGWVNGAAGEAAVARIGVWCDSMEWRSSFATSPNIPAIGLYVNSSLNLQPRLLFPLAWAFDTLASVNAWLKGKYDAGEPVSILYALKEPVEIQLTPTEITALLGSNIVTADTGNVTVEYTADTKLYIDKRLAELSQGS